MHTVICRLSFEHKVFSNTCQGKICNADDKMPSECSDEVNSSQVPALLLMSYALYCGATHQSVYCSFATLKRRKKSIAS